MCGIARHPRPGPAPPRPTVPRCPLAATMASTLGPSWTRRPTAPGWTLRPGWRSGTGAFSVIDLGPGGALSPWSPRGAAGYSSYNGEVYNHPATSRRRLADAGTPLPRDSDTEVLLEAVERRGLDRALDACEGDVRRRPVGPAQTGSCTWCATASARSRCTTAGPGFRSCSGSELKALHGVPGFRRELDRGAVAGYLQHSCAPVP